MYIYKAMTPHSSTLAWKIPWTEEPVGCSPWLRVGHDLATSLSLSLSCIGEGNGNPLQCSWLENPRDRGAWWAAVYGVAQSRTRLKQLSSRVQVYLVPLSTSRRKWHLENAQNYAEEETGFLLYKEFSNLAHGGA